MYLNFAILAIDNAIEKVTGEDTGALGDLPEKTAGIGNSFISLLLIIGIFSIVAGCIMIGMRVVVGGQTTRAEAKGRIPDILIGAVLIFGVLSIIGALASFIPHLFS